ncbi:MAG: hypothetical protein K0V04_27340 [Deltaproteobacteria bacterium]|nr:hypothetical protein [Deltaproteobacteria bacterium]
MTDEGPADSDPAPGGPPDSRTRADDHDEGRGSYESRACWLAALAAMAIGALLLPGTLDFPLDDAWIHLSYAKSLRLGDGASYNPGDHELGFSSPLWMLLLSVWPIEGDPVRPVQLLGLLLHGLTAWVAAHLALCLARRRATLERPVPVLSLTLLAGVLTAAHPGLVQSSVSGMEVSLCAALSLAVAWAMMEGRVGTAAVTGALAVWARPEALGFVLLLAAVLAPWRWRATERGATVRAPIAAAVSAVVALVVWLSYCQAMQGQWWPNTQVVKGPGGGLGGLTYLAERVLPWQPWLVGLTGVVLLALALRRDLCERRPELLALLVAATGTWVAIAITRPLEPALLFYLRRYFIPFAAAFCVVLPFGLPLTRRWLAVGLVLPVALVCGLQIDSAYARSQAQRGDTHQVHTAVGKYLAAQLPPDARVAVEGAGANRYFTPRSMTLIDLVGLNDHETAAWTHVSNERKMCRFIERQPTHFAIPAHWVGDFSQAFAFRPLARFDDPVYTQGDPPFFHTVVVLEVVAVEPRWAARCEQ